MAADRRLVVLLLAACALAGCARHAPASSPQHVASPRAGVSLVPVELQSVLSVVDAESATALRLRGRLQVLPDGAERDIQLWLTRAGAMRLEVGGSVELVSDGASLWAFDGEEWRRQSAGRASAGGNATLLISPFDLGEALLPMPMGLADAALLLQQDADQLRLVLVDGEAEPPRPRRAVTVSPDGRRVLRRQLYGGGAEVLRVDYFEPGGLDLWRASAASSLRIRVVELERDPPLPAGVFTPRR